MEYSEAVRRAELNLKKAILNLDHAMQKPNSQEVELNHLREKIEYADIVCSALYRLEERT